LLRLLQVKGIRSYFGMIFGVEKFLVNHTLIFTHLQIKKTSLCNLYYSWMICKTFFTYHYLKKLTPNYVIYTSTCKDCRQQMMLISGNTYGVLTNIVLPKPTNTSLDHNQSTQHLDGFDIFHVNKNIKFFTSFYWRTDFWHSTPKQGWSVLTRIHTRCQHRSIDA
jgi:hypothetical protein